MTNTNQSCKQYNTQSFAVHYEIFQLSLTFYCQNNQQVQAYEVINILSMICIFESYQLKVALQIWTTILYTLCPNCNMAKIQIHFRKTSFNKKIYNLCVT